MKILLIYPYFIEERIQGEDIKAVPMGLYWIAALLKENHYDVEILDWHDIERSPELVEQTLRSKKPAVIGFSVLHGNRWGAIEIARKAKSLDPNVKIVFGGVGASFLWEHFLSRFREVDFVVIGEGEYSFLELIRHLEGADPASARNISGLAFRENAKPIRTRARELIEDLDELPIPARYFNYQHVSFTRGCTWECTFCGSPLFWGKRLRFRSPQHFVEELGILYKRGTRFFFFSDDNFMAKKNYVIEICRKIIEKSLDITWYAISRVNYVDEEMLLWMRKAGCVQISYGVESGSEGIRNTLKKNIKTKQITRAFSLTTKYGILPRAYFIYGSPGETWETIRESISLMHQIKPLSAIFYILDIFPGTELYSELKKRLAITDDIWLKKIEGIMYFETDPNLSDELIVSFGKKLREDFYENVHAYAGAIRLIDKKELYNHHADFCSRLGMTFSHGDYSRIEAVKQKLETAEYLYGKSLSYAPNSRAYLGLGIVMQRQGSFEESISLLSEAIEAFPDDEHLHLCLGVSYMNIGDFGSALFHFSKFPNSKTANSYADQCRRALAGR
ncbi:MAG: B12-binding domain-containing radical SAM protein [Deltaproteobacteria bacterium]|nr:MAG: B12-binding domain-containing radical SAM protein [Deltaproteobacteria bacterium]